MDRRPYKEVTGTPTFNFNIISQVSHISLNFAKFSKWLMSSKSNKPNFAFETMINRQFVVISRNHDFNRVKMNESYLLFLRN